MVDKWITCRRVRGYLSASPVAIFVMASARICSAIRCFLACAGVFVAHRASAQHARCASSAGWHQLILEHRIRYPEMGIADAFKLLQQATMGSEHAVGSTAEASAWMDREWAGLGDGPTEPLLDTLGHGSKFVRIHLRPYRSAGGKPAALVAAFVETAHTSPRDTAALGCAIDALVAMAKAKEVPWAADSISRQAGAWRARGYPAIEHSISYERAYRPAYRVVSTRLVAPLLAGLKRSQ
jgi:hypothetical protein